MSGWRKTVALSDCKFAEYAAEYQHKNSFMQKKWLKMTAKLSYTITDLMRAAIRKNDQQ